jgi:hypothetical protein
LAALVEVVVEVCKLFAVWVKRKVFALATAITRASSWISSLSGRLGLTSLSDRIRADTLEQESIFVEEQEKQDRELYEAYLRDRARRRRMLQGGALPPEPEELDDADDTTLAAKTAPTTETAPAAQTAPAADRVPAESVPVESEPVLVEVGAATPAGDGQPSAGPQEREAAKTA